MNRVLSAWKWLRVRIQSRTAELRLSLRVTAAALATFALSEFAQLPLVLWPVVTSIIVTQLSVGKSLKTTIDYFAGTLGGAVYGGIISMLFPPATEPTAMAVLAAAIAPLTFLAAVNPSFSVAPLTAAIVVLGPLVTHATPIESAYYRLLEVALGGGTGLAVSLMLWPSRAHGLALETVARLLNLMAESLGELLSRIPEGLDAMSLQRIHSGILQPFTRLEAIEGEARREQMVRLGADPDVGPLVRTLRRLPAMI